MKSPRRSRFDRRGFTLLEVILAVAIFVGAIAVLSKLFALGGENVLSAEQSANAWIVAESAWSELEAGARSLEESGPFEVEGMPGWQWSMEAIPSELPDLYQVTIRVGQATSTAEPPLVELTRLFFDDGAGSSTEDSL